MTALEKLKAANNGEIIFMGQQFLCDHEGALYWPEQECLIVSDLHLEKGKAMAGTGSLVPPYDTKITLQRLSDCLAKWKPNTVISLGDSFHRDDSAQNLTASDREIIQQMSSKYQWVWISGNHDPVAPAGLGGSAVDELAIGEIVLRHEQQIDALGEISGHLHPSARIRQRGKNLRRKCFASDGTRLIMPAFGAYTGGLDIGNQAFEGLFDNTKLQVWMLGRDRVYQISASQLR